MFRTSTPPTAPRHGSTGPRSRGGIQKRSSRSTARVDIDGDLDMEATTSNGNGRAGGRGRRDGSSSARGQPSTRAGRGAGRGIVGQRAQQAILRGLDAGQATMLDSRITKAGGGESITLKVDGLSSSKAAANKDGGVESLLAFLERKANGQGSKSSKAVRIRKSRKEGDSVFITVSQDDSGNFLKLNSFVFAGSPLSVTALDEKISPSASNHKDKKEELSDGAQKTHDELKAVLSTRYDTDLKLLNLSALGRDPALKQMGIFKDDSTIQKLFPALMRVCDKIFTSSAAKTEAIISVTLTDNDLIDTSLVSELSRTFPNIKNLDLSRNKFATVKSLEGWRNRLRKLENLVLVDNPVCVVPFYQMDIIRWFPRLTFLNGIPVRTAEEVALAKPTPMKAPNFQDLTTDQQQAEVKGRLAAMTGMTLEYAELCLTETGGDIEKAYNAFVANKANLPPNAFREAINMQF